MTDSYIGPNVAHLLLARGPHFLHVVKVLLDRGTVGERFQNVDDAGIRIGTGQSETTMISLDQYDPNHSTDWRIGGQERFISFGNLLAVQCALDGFSGSLLSRSLGQTDLVSAYLRG